LPFKPAAVSDYRIECVQKLKIFKKCDFFFLVVNKPPPRALILMGDDSKKVNASSAAVDMLLTSDLTDSAKSAPPDKAVAANRDRLLPG
jgi:hypothetical protein